ncbi:hypothetical protein D3C85_1275040 [compost metagenome]
MPSDHFIPFLKKIVNSVESLFTSKPFATFGSTVLPSFVKRNSDSSVGEPTVQRSFGPPQGIFQSPPYFPISSVTFSTIMSSLAGNRSATGFNVPAVTSLANAGASLYPSIFTGADATAAVSFTAELAVGLSLSLSHATKQGQISSSSLLQILYFFASQSPPWF